MVKTTIFETGRPIRRSLRLQAWCTSTPVLISDDKSDSFNESNNLEQNDNLCGNLTEDGEIEAKKCEENTQNTTILEEKEDTTPNSTLNCSCSCNCSLCRSCSLKKSPIIIENLRRKLTAALVKGNCTKMIEKIEKLEAIKKNVKKIKNKISSNMKNSQNSTNTESDEENITIKLDNKIDNLLASASLSSDSEKEERNSLIESEAEEGEEDTPSEDSNAIVEVGEEIHTESDRSSDQSYDRNSFIDDESEQKLLSGEEYDLSWNSPQKWDRILELSSGSDNEIVPVKKKEKKPVKKRRKSRIIKFEDSSDEDEKIIEENQSEAQKTTSEAKRNGEKIIDKENESKTVRNVRDSEKIVILENVRVQDIKNKELSEGINQVLKIFLTKSSSDTISPNASATNTCQVRKKIRRKFKHKKSNGSLQRENKNKKNESSVEITKKRKLSKSDDSLPPQPPLKKKKKNKKRQKQAVEENTQLSLIEEVILDQKEKETTVLLNGWNMKNIQLKPSKSKKLEKSPKNFHSRDFRNLMLYDTSRNKRTKTTSFLQRKF